MSISFTAIMLEDTDTQFRTESTFLYIALNGYLPLYT